jgi:hypothetical protein
LIGKNAKNSRVIFSLVPEGVFSFSANRPFVQIFRKVGNSSKIKVKEKIL